jgi:psiF repeat
MRRSIWVAVLAAGLAAGAGQVALAQAGSPNTQQQKMKSCNADATAKGLSGDDRKAFMKSCLSTEGADTKANSQQERMKACNADAKRQGLTGDTRKSFMKSCLSGSGG